MFTEYKEMVSHPGRYERECPMVAYLGENSEYADEESGDVEAPTGYFARFGRWLLTWDDRGFIYGRRFDSRAAAVAQFAALDNEYCEWDNEDAED